MNNKQSSGMYASILDLRTESGHLTNAANALFADGSHAFADLRRRTTPLSRSGAPVSYNSQNRIVPRRPMQRLGPRNAYGFRTSFS